MIKSYSHHFRIRRYDNSPVIRDYITGLVSGPTRLKNMERMEEAIGGSSYQSLQQILSDSPWSHRAVLDQVASDAGALLGGRSDSMLVIDDSAFTKKGTKSVGVARQWSGRLGKVENSQVGVYAALASGDDVTLIDAELYLPSEWATDPQRCIDAGVPVELIQERSKLQIASEMVRRARGNGVGFSWIAADGFYGNSQSFLRELDDMNERFICEVHCNQHVYITDPTKADPSERVKFRADSLAKMIRPNDWKTVKLREGTKGSITSRCFKMSVWLWDPSESTSREWQLLVMRIGDENRYTLTNAERTIKLAELAAQGCRRYWIERAFEDAKGSLGMADYQVRGWRGWNHHMALVILAQLFVTSERIRNKQTLPLMSSKDVVELLEFYLPTRNPTPEELVERMKERHRKRQIDIDRNRNRTTERTLRHEPRKRVITK